MAHTCTHISTLEGFSGPKLSQSVHREECTQCFDNQDTEDGVDICLSCFNGGCNDEKRHHAYNHANKTGHTFTFNIKRRPKPTLSKREDSDEPPAKMAKLAIVEEKEEDKFDHTITLKCWQCDPNAGKLLPEVSEVKKVKELSREIMTSLSSAKQSEVKAWEEEITACEHTLMLEQTSKEAINEAGLAHCHQCDLKENLWLCLACGSLGCGRQYSDGTGGRGHALQHYNETHHAINVKLGTITPEGTADVYCYDCDDARLDLDLAVHLSTYGINIKTQTKTEKSMTELQIEQNYNFDFKLTDESGKALDPVFGPELTGLQNLGNSCYMASVIQALFSLSSFQDRYYPTASLHWQSCNETLPATCLECQMIKLADGLISGRYSKPRTSFPGISPLKEEVGPEFQEGLRPADFKSLIGKGHAEFATMRQQDAEEFLSHILTVLRQDSKRRGLNEENQPTEIFKFGLEQRLECNDCKRVRYRVDSQDSISVPIAAKEREKDSDGKVIYEDVTLVDSLSTATGDEALEYQCPNCRQSVVAVKQSRFSTFPQVLVIHAKKFQLVNWVPTKIDVPVILPENDELILDSYLGQGLKSGEIELPDETVESDRLIFNETAIAQLTAMGFPEIRCQKALLATGNSDPESAMEWLFAHMDDPDIDDPIPTTQNKSSKGCEPSSEQVGMLTEMGFTPAQARKALRETDGNAERAVEWLFSHPDDTGEDTNASSNSTPNVPRHPGGSKALPARYQLKAFISHKGPSVHSGHYVVHIKKDEVGWIFYNDEKVVKADEESVNKLKKLAYLYVFERK